MMAYCDTHHLSRCSPRSSINALFDLFFLHIIPRADCSDSASDLSCAAYVQIALLLLHVVVNEAYTSLSCIKYTVCEYEDKTIVDRIILYTLGSDTVVG